MSGPAPFVDGALHFVPAEQGSLPRVFFVISDVVFPASGLDVVVTVGFFVTDGVQDGPPGGFTAALSAVGVNEQIIVHGFLVLIVINR